jgi:RES domain-containing protein
MRRKPPTFIAWSGVVYRATSYDVPLWVNPNRRGGRWNLPGVHCTQYCCLDAEAPFAELLRHEDLPTEASASHYFSTVWQLRIDEGAITDYGTFDKAEAAGFQADALVEDDHERCQAEADWLMSHGSNGILSPSAALPGSVNLTVFGPRVPVPWNTLTTLASSVPAQKIASGHPPPGLTQRTRYIGQEHSLLAAFTA